MKIISIILLALILIVNASAFKMKTDTDMGPFYANPADTMAYIRQHYGNNLIPTSLWRFLINI